MKSNEDFGLSQQPVTQKDLMDKVQQVKNLVAQKDLYMDQSKPNLKAENESLKKQVEQQRMQIKILKQQLEQQQKIID